MTLLGSTGRALVALLVASSICTGTAQTPAEHTPVTPPHKVVFKVENLENGKPAEFIVAVHPEWAPVAAKHFMDLVKQKHFDGVRFHHVLSGFAAKFGISGDPSVTTAMRNTKLPDEPLIQLNTRGKLAFVPDGPNGRSTQLIINGKENLYHDHHGYVPFATVDGGIGVVDRLYSRYGQREPPKGQAPSIERIEKEGTPYLAKDFPKLSYIRTVLIMEENFPQPVKPPSSHKLYLALGAFVMAMIVGGGWHLWSATLMGAKHPDTSCSA